MPSLQLHMYRVTAVASRIVDNWKGENLDKKEIIIACLLHDIGNIIKFKLGYIPEALEPEGLDYWEAVKKEFIEKYGKDEHEATHKIAREIEVSERIFEIISAIGFSKSVENTRESDFRKKISCYSDHRVTPGGIASLEKRMQSGRKRFEVNKGISDLKKAGADFEMYAKGMRKLEKQIFQKCSIKPEDIADESVAPYLEKMKEVEI